MNVTDATPAEMEPVSRKPRILYVITKANWGGAQKYVFDLATAAEERGYYPDVACGAEGELSERLMRAHIPVLFVPGLGRDVSVKGDVTALATLTHLLRTNQPDIVHANSSKAGFIATIAGRLAGVPRIIFTAHGWAFNESRPWWQRAVFGFFHLITVWCAHEVICVSEAVKRDAAWMSFGLPFISRKFTVIHNGVSEVKLVEKGLARAKLAPHLTSQVWIGTLAELHPTKGLDVAIEAFAKIASEFPQTTLVLIGEGQERNTLVTLAKKLHLQDRVRFCGHVSDAATLLKAFDIFLFPSRSEALGFAALEAGNASLPVVASRVGGIPEIIEDGVSGLLVPVNDVSAFATALTSLLKNPNLGTQLGSSLHSRVHKNFSQSQMIEKTFALY